ncbi:antibiotic biosynthesis monooxygenase [Opitutaceae bacterium]|nr:antibiotic biosynthesis monooxygenase [Opitutaceae bacterium]
MSEQVALIVGHRTKPGQRDAMRAVWEEYIKPNVRDNPGHLAYYFNTVADDPDGVVAYQIFTNEAAKDAFLASDWYPEYLEKVSVHVAEPPEITTASVVWSKQDLPV